MGQKLNAASVVIACLTKLWEEKETYPKLQKHKSFAGVYNVECSFTRPFRHRIPYSKNMGKKKFHVLTQKQEGLEEHIGENPNLI